MGKIILDVNDVCKSFSYGSNNLEVLKNFTLQLNKKEIITISGQSGCGKSTALNIMGTLDRQDSGTISFEGIDINKLDENSLANFRNTKIGFVFQFHHLLPELTALENASIPLWIKGAPFLEDELIDLFETLGIKDRMNHYPGELSGGERSRVALIRAIINRPSILFADEPTGNLDSKTAETVFEQFISLARKNNTSVLLATHNTKLSEKSDRIIKIIDGKLVEN